MLYCNHMHNLPSIFAQGMKTLNHTGLTAVLGKR